MKTIRIKDLHLQNFKGAKAVSLEFTGDVTTISGRNATGKTTIMDAFLWLLWGLNSQDQQTSKFGIKPTDSEGNSQNDLNPEVSGTFEVLDTETGEVGNIQLRRRWTSQWRTRKGETEREFKGNKGEYFVNDVPVTEAEYNAKVAAMMPAEIFKAITNPYYFAGLHWKAKREILMSITEAVTYQDVAHGHAEFEKLLRDITGKTVEELAKEIAVRIAAINKEIDKIPGKIEEVDNMTPITPDYAALEIRKTELENEIKDIETALFDANKAQEASMQATRYRAQKIASLEDQQRKVLAEAQEAAWKETLQANKEHQRAKNTLDSLISGQRLWEEANTEKRRQLEEAKRGHERNIAETESRTEGLRKEWYRLNEMTYPGSETLVCPLSNQPCGDAEACARHRNHYHEQYNAFIDNIDRQQAAIQAQGEELNAEINRIKGLIKSIDDQIAALDKEREDKAAAHEAQRMIAQLTVDKTLHHEPTEIKGEDLPEWVELQKQIDELRNEPVTTTTIAPETTDDILKRRAQLTTELDEVKRELGLRTIIEQMEARKQELQKQEKNLVQERANLQLKDVTIAALTAARMAEIERRVNAKFTRVRFEMFEPTATTGDEKPNCVCWVGGVRYQDDNRASQVNAGIDIINALCRHHQATAPIFIDNAECVNEFIPTESQLVLLKVTDGDFTIS